MSRIKQNVMGNIINTTSDLEWFMINFIRHYEEMVDMLDLTPAREDLEADVRIAEQEAEIIKDKYNTLEENYNVLRENYLELYAMYIKAKNKGKIASELKGKHREFRKELEFAITDDDLPF